MTEKTIEDFGDYIFIRKFLLHQLEPDSSAKVEERFFCDPQFKELVLIAEEELMEDFVLERLSSDERQRVQKYLLSTAQQREKLQSIADLMRGVNRFSDESSSKKTLFDTLKDFTVFFSKPFVFAAVLLLICFTIATILFLKRENKPALNAALLQRIESLNRENSDSLENISSSVFEIKRVTERSANAAQNNRVFIKSGDKIIEYQLAISEYRYKSYQATISKFNSSPLVTVKDLSLSQKNGSSFLRVKFPSEIFEKGFYEINVAGVNGVRLEELGTFSFEVVITN